MWVEAQILMLVDSCAYAGACLGDVVQFLNLPFHCIPLHSSTHTHRLPMVKVLRILRAFRIVRVFKRLDALRIICTSMVLIWQTCLTLLIT